MTPGGVDRYRPQRQQQSVEAQSILTQAARCHMLYTCKKQLGKDNRSQAKQGNEQSRLVDFTTTE